MSDETARRSTFGLHLSAPATRALEALRRLRVPRGGTPTPKSHVIERALLALAEVEGIDVTAEI